MAKLRLSALDNDKPVKVIVELPATVHRDPVIYVDYRNHQLSQSHLLGE